MTYKDVLSDLTNLLDRHKMIQTWGYGNLSDLVSPFKKEDKTGNETTVYDIDYPYAFLQPLQHSLSKGKVAYNFNLIMMEQCENDPTEVIQAQSNCQQYIQDVLAEIYYNYDQKYDFTLNSSLTPFKEKYDDTVSGMTANIQIEIPMILDDCIAPFDPIIPAPEQQLVVQSTQDQLFRPDVAQSPLAFQDVILDTQTGWRPPAGSNFFKPKVAGTWKFILTAEVTLDADQGDWPDNPEMLHRLGSNNTVTVPTTSTWPSTQPAVGETVPFECVWEDYLHIPTIPWDPNNDFLFWNWIDEPQPEDQFRILEGATLIGYFTPTV